MSSPITLKDRKLRFDGVSVVEPDNLAKFLLLGVPPSKLRVTIETPEVFQFNDLVTDEEAIRLACDEPTSPNLSWQLPQYYQNLDIDDYCINIFSTKMATLNYTAEQLEQAANRIVEELKEIKRLEMTNFFRTIIFILDELRASNVVWGVGRGSSCASYLLFILGLHLVDCVLLDVPRQEFFHE